MHKDLKQVLFTQDEIWARVAQMGDAITADYKNESEGIVLISVLRGAAIFMSDLARQIKLPCEMDYMAVSSYGSGVKSSGVVRILKDLSSSIEGRHVLIAEDIIDSGLTLTYLMKSLKARKPASLNVVALIKKNVETQTPVDCKYIGFDAPNEFIVGYGLDYAERYRNLPYIGILKESIYAE